MRVIPALPLAAAVAIALLGPRVLKRSCHALLVVALLGSLVASVLLARQVLTAGAHGEDHAGKNHAAAAASPEADEHSTAAEIPQTTLWRWAAVEGATSSSAATYASSGGEPFAESQPLDFTIDITLRADALTAIMLVMVTFVSLLVAIYSIGYMHDDRGYWRFFSYVGLFVFSMTMLVLSSNFLLLYVFWEAVGVCSYLLIGFWYEKPEASAAGKKAFLVNRVGDFGFALGIFLIWTLFGTLNFHDTSAIDGVLGLNRIEAAAYPAGIVATAICLLLFVGACGKSAQFPLHVWLPDAMEGPTPVSALIHAATMVTAGIYMVARCTPLFAASGYAGYVVAGIGGFTALLAGLIAVTQTDLKRVLAYSTVSQLGYMFLALGVGSAAGIAAGMFHLITHAFFKALLFLGAGSVMHAMGGVIDMRRFGGLRRLMPVTHWTFLIGCLALAGLFPLAGFWSKDAILAAVYDEAAAHGTGDWEHAATFFNYLFLVASFTAFLTAFYTFRAFFRTFYGEERIPPEAGHHAHESPAVMTVPLMILAVLAAVSGYLLHVNETFAHWLAQTPGIPAVVHHEGHSSSHSFVAMLSTILAVGGIGLAAYFYLGELTQIDRIARWLRPLYVASYGKFWFDPLYQLLIVGPLWLLAQLAYFLDRYLIDGLVNLVGYLPRVFGGVLRRVQNGMLQLYVLGMIVALLLLAAAVVLPRLPVPEKPAESEATSVQPSPAPIRVGHRPPTLPSPDHTSRPLRGEGVR
ncbi:MAG: NADH-quinone oxidoreductase subunit L [Planctomycetota bacterium]|nr:MAG: NADH-quinone oxidoreductase subunit L [Planctomycetota bacterium]REJ91439.1 MAG: NADH-quinone oxidoreductase subunit L [Planctomycetota bacterium]REK18538.1 MAG: NADH-quinone oxidoreductase subunit L [Planctomycetota bacterium]REK39512.1 MAG: NADH-quinone oxidoreductase subunit L [Planctomycetota bacterium]